MAADFTRANKRVLEILNAVASGDYSTALSPRNKTRNAQAIIDAGYEAGLKIIQVIASTVNEFRGDFINVVSVTNGELLPAHLGKPAFVEIQKFAGAEWRAAKHKKYRKIESYRQNESNAYDAIAHNEEGSTLAGYYDVWDKKIYFTGYAARVGLAQAVRGDVLTKIPDIFEPTLVKLWLSNCVKAGEGAVVSQIAERYYAQGMNDLNEFKAGTRAFEEVSDPEPTSEVHND